MARESERPAVRTSHTPAGHASPSWLVRLPDTRAVAARAADLVAEVVAEKPAAVLVLPAGSTPVPLYAELARRSRAGALSLERAHLFQLDELLGVAPRDERSFHRFLEEHVARPCELGARLHRLDGTAPDPAAEIARHARELRDLGGADLVLLGLGKNGHVGFNEPGSRATDGARPTALSPTTVREFAESFDGSPAPHRGITLGLAEIASGRRIRILVSGATKAEILSELVRSAPSSERPASLLLGHPDLAILADEAALSRLG